MSSTQDWGIHTESLRPAVLGSQAVLMQGVSQMDAKSEFSKLTCHFERSNVVPVQVRLLVLGSSGTY